MKRVGRRSLDGRSAGHAQGEGKALGGARILGGQDMPQQDEGGVREAPRREDRGQVVLGADRVDIGVLQRGDPLPDGRSRRRIVPVRGRQAASVATRSQTVAAAGASSQSVAARPTRIAANKNKTRQ